MIANTYASDIIKFHWKRIKMKIGIFGKIQKFGNKFKIL